ncbi:MAG: hypothetical protein AB7T63_05745 [Planctomycetota bacterium]
MSGRRVIKTILLAACCWCLGVPRSALAAPTKEQQQFLDVLVKSLSSKDPAIVAAATAALGSMGGPAAERLVGDLGRLRGQALERAIDILIRLDKHTRRALEERGKGRTPAERSAIETIEEYLSPPAGDTGFGTSPPDVAAKIDEILDGLPTSSWSSDHPDVARMVALGRDALPHLLTYLEPQGAKQDDIVGRGRWALDAACRLVTSRDVPRLGALLDKGWLPVAGCLQAVDDPAAISYIAHAISQGFMGLQLGEAAKHYAPTLGGAELGPAIVSHLSSYGDKFPAGMPDLLRAAAELQLVEVLPFVDRIEAAPSEFELGPGAIVPDGFPEPDLHRKLACRQARALLGEKRGLRDLVQLLDRRGVDAWVLTWAMETLEDATKAGISSGRHDTGDAKRKQWEAWIDENYEALTWDPKQRRYVR